MKNSGKMWNLISFKNKNIKKLTDFFQYISLCRISAEIPLFKLIWRNRLDR